MPTWPGSCSSTSAGCSTTAVEPGPVDPAPARGPALHVPRSGPLRRRRDGPRVTTLCGPSPRPASSASRRSTCPAATPSRRVARSMTSAWPIASAHTWADHRDPDAVARAAAGVGRARGAADDRVRTWLRYRGRDRRVRGRTGGRRRDRRRARAALRLPQPRRGDDPFSTAARAIERLAAGLDGSIDLQVDIFWVVVGGADPATVVGESRRTGRVAPRQGRGRSCRRAPTMPSRS